MKLPFDKVYCIHSIENTDIYNNLINELTRLDIKHQTDIWWICEDKISENIGNMIQSLHNLKYDNLMNKYNNIYSFIFKMTFEHYTIIKQSYLRGFNNILIFEDNILFNKNINLILDIFNNLPLDYDIIKFHNNNNNIKYNNYDYKCDFILCDETNINCYNDSTLCYALSRDGMKNIIDFYDNTFISMENVLNCLQENVDINYYIISSNVICDYFVNKYSMITSSNLILPFDKIYCLHLVENKDRYQSVLEECNKINLENKISFWYTTKKPINSIIGDHINTLHDVYYDKWRTINEDTYGNVFDCSYNHYSIIKQAYLRGFKSILIIEDDILFNENTKILNKIIKQIPNDYDILKLYNEHNQETFITNNKNINNINNTEKLYNLYNKNANINDNCFELLNENNYYFYYHSTLCYALSRNGMKALIESYESFFGASDITLNNVRLNKNINFYTLKYNIFCNPKGFGSTIVNY